MAKKETRTKNGGAILKEEHQIMDQVEALKDRILRMFAECLANGGFLCLGNRESLEFSAVSDVFETVDREGRIYKKKAVT